MKRILILLCIFSSCSTDRNDEYTAERYRVYETILEQELPWSQFKKVLVSNETTQWIPVSAQQRDTALIHFNDLSKLKNYWQDFEPDTFLTDFTARNAHPNPVDINLFHYCWRIDSINLRVANYNDYFRDDDIDHAIVYCYSMPSFNKGFTEAILYYQYYCGHSRGQGAWYWLRKREQDWVIVGKHRVWWS